MFMKTYSTILVSVKHILKIANPNYQYNFTKTKQQQQIAASYTYYMYICNMSKLIINI